MLNQMSWSNEAGHGHFNVDTVKETIHRQSQIEPITHPSEIN